jgi:Flp pilus assembly protein TadD
MRMPTVTDLFSLAFRQHQAGSLAQAEQLYRQVLQTEPSHADAWSCLGAACQAQGKLTDAQASYQEALRLSPGHASAHNCLGVLLAQQGQLSEALSNFRAAAQSAPQSPEIVRNLCLALFEQGNVVAKQGDLNQAVGLFQEALRIRPNYPEAHNNLGNVLLLLQRPSEAAAHCREALRLRPDFPEAHNNLGNALLLLGKVEEAAKLCAEAIRLRPEFPEALNNLGNALERQGKWEEAFDCYRRALALKPDVPEVLNNMGNVLLAQDRLDDAVGYYQRAMCHKSRFAEACANLGSARKYQYAFDEAVACYREALDYDPGHAETHFNLGLILLLQGKWAEGWPEYEWRWQTKGFPRFKATQPLWDGSPLDGRTLLVLSEQGLGDTLQFIRYLPLIKDRGGRVIVRCQPALRHILAERLGMEDLAIEGNALPHFDVYTQLLRLPGLLGTTAASVPASIPYLIANEQLVDHWQCLRCGVRNGECDDHSSTPHSALRTPYFLIGIAWQGNPRFSGDRQRSIPLTAFAPLADSEGVQLVSLQKGPGLEQMLDGGQWTVDGKAPSLSTVHRPPSTFDEASGAFMDTAAMMRNLDLVICSDSAVAHLAGALGVPVWVALPWVPDWRWLLEREDSPWYPTMRLFRQIRPGDWQDVFERIHKQLKCVIDARRTQKH